MRHQVCGVCSDNNFWGWVGPMRKYFPSGSVGSAHPQFRTGGQETEMIDYAFSRELIAGWFCLLESTA